MPHFLITEQIITRTWWHHCVKFDISNFINTFVIFLHWFLNLASFNNILDDAEVFCVI